MLSIGVIFAVLAVLSVAAFAGAVTGAAAALEGSSDAAKCATMTARDFCTEGPGLILTGLQQQYMRPAQ